MRSSAFAVILLLGIAIGPSSVVADGEQSLAKQSQNPVGDVISLPFENNTGF